MTRTRKPRRKATTDLGRSILQRERQKLAREQAVLAEKAALDGKQLLATKRLISRSSARHSAEIAFERSIVRRVAGVLASEGVSVPIETKVVSGEDQMSAWTDFSRIHVEYHVFDDVKLTAATMRGLFYHEGGHCRFTMPLADLLDQAMKAYGLSKQDDLLSSVGRGRTLAQLQRAWNCLEDQRMETAVVSDSPRKAAYLTPMVLAEMADTPSHAAANYPLFIWRRYLPAKVRKGAREAFVQMHGQDGIALDNEFRAVTDRYVLGTEVRELFEAVVDMTDLMERHQIALNLDDVGHDHQGYGYRYNRGGGQVPDLDVPIDPSMLDDSDTAPNEGAGQGQGQPSSGAAKPGKGKSGKGEKADDAQGSKNTSQGEGAKGTSSKAGGSSGTHESDDAGFGNDDHADQGSGADQGDEGDGDDDGAGAGDGTEADHSDPLSQEELDEMLAEAEEERMSDPTLDNDVRAFQDAKDTMASNLPVYTGGVDADPYHNAAANNLADNMRRSFEVATVNQAPSWHEQQRRGIINVNRYSTRQPGDVEFFRSYVDDGDPGFDMAVSVLLDYSGSMGSVTDELAQVAYACKVACQTLGIPCTVVLWDTEARTLWDANERAEHLPKIQAAGGTNPLVALTDLDNQNQEGKAKHIILVMTDDAWSGGSPSLSSYRAEDRMIIGLGYGGDHMAESMASRGADAAYTIKDLADIAKYLEQALIANA
jgi:hypothetical protein